MYRRSLLAAALVAFPLLAIAGCAQTAAPAPRTLVVFFTADSAALDSPAQAAIQQAAEAVRANPAAIAHIRGFAAPDAGSDAFNKSLSQTRAQAVADALTVAGVPTARIRMESRGAVAYDLMPTESRRVEIVIGA